MRTKLLSLALLFVPVSAWGAPDATYGDFDSRRISEHVRILASDAFEGRAPGSAGEDRTLAYLIDQFSALGLEPGAPDGRWLQPVRLTRMTRPVDGTYSVDTANGSITLVEGRDAIVAAVVPGKVDIADAPLVFVGYGLEAPDVGWNDLDGVDLTGKVAVFISRVPQAAGFDELQRALYNPVRARLESLLAHGALGAIYFTKGVRSDDWQRTVNSFRAAQYDMPRDWWSDQAPPALLTVPEDVAESLFARAGLDFASLTEAAEKPGFSPVALTGLRLSAHYEVIGDEIVTHNVIGRLSGRSRPDEAVLFSAHWDHLGHSVPDASGDDIYNGAIDNAAGVADLLELARVFASNERTERTLLFLATTGEELGFWGIRAYADEPSIPLERTAAMINIDTVALAGPTRQAEIIGNGQTTIDSNEAVRAAAAQGRDIAPPQPDSDRIYFRGDHIVLARRGVPAFYLGWGNGRLEEGPYAGENFYAFYHQPSDEWRPEYDWRGAAQDLELRYLVGRAIANSSDWPQWNVGSVYRSVREKSRDQRR